MKMEHMITQLLAIFCAAGFAGCATTERDKSAISEESWSDVVKEVETKAKSPDLFGKPGPFEAREIRDYQLPLSPTNKVLVDLFIPKLKDKSPLVIMVHGNKFNKLVHGSQCRHLASWGFHCLAVQVPNEGQWLTNGKTIENLVRLINSYPTLLSEQIKPDKIILVGHSFGGSAVTIAAGRKAPIAGIILLDPAVVHPKLRDHMVNVGVPVILLGADPGIFASRKRKLFYRNIAGPMSEVSVAGATHNDAQLPSIDTVEWGFDVKTTKKYQETFLQTIVASAFSIGAFDSVTYAWKSFEPYLKSGILKAGKVRSAKQKSDLFNR
jgi:pimeloyl-ACP methyl ester carboxylesterase